MRIYTPVKDFNGLRNNVRFVNGVGETNDLALVEWFKSHGYKVDGEVEDKNVKFVFNPVISAQNDQIARIKNEIDDFTTIPSEPTELDFENMTPNDLRDWAKANGLSGAIKNTRNKEKLLEIIKQHRG